MSARTLPVLVLLALMPAAPLGAQKPAPAAAPEWLAICARCPSPTVTSKSGIGTAKAVAEARMNRETITGEEGVCAAADNACIMTELKKVYRASADCTAGSITPVDGKTYTLAGLWDRSDIGGGRTMWRDAAGEVVGRDNASGGLGISQQWEVLCPGPVSAALIAKATAAASARQPVRVESQNPPVCGGIPHCTEVNAFAMTVVDFRASLTQPTKLLTLAARFQNKTDRPLLLGYVPGSGTAMDERSNRYAGNDADVRGIGVIAARGADAKFVLQPGGTGDARFTYVWQAGRAVYGTTFDVELTVRELIPLGNNQLELGAEYPLRVAGLVNGVTAPVTTTAAAATAPAGTPAPPAAAPPQVDHCAESSRPCYAAGPFSATVTGVAGSVVGGRHHVLRLNVALKNHSGEPLILGYKSNTSNAIDNQGNAYGWGRPGTHDTSVEGIGLVSARNADMRFALRPNESRNAVFAVTRFNSGQPTSTSYTFDTVLVELRVLPNGTQSESVREYAVHLPDLTLGSGAAPTVDGLTDAAKKLRGIFQRKPPGR